MHAPYILSAEDLGAISLEFCRKPYMLEADDCLGARYRKAMTPKKLCSPRCLKLREVLYVDGPRKAFHLDDSELRLCFQEE